jgi:ABC-type transport system involved in multi-copper enzyme maturation permease subunit
MSWLTWRQYRLQAIVTAAVLAAVGALLLVTGLQLAAQWHADLAACAAAHSCGSQQTSLSAAGLGNDLSFISLVLPGVLGILLGAPLAAGEIESGTANFAWTQGITRTRWLAVKAGWLLLAAAAACGAASALVTWWSGPVNAANANAFRATVFDRQGIVPVGYALFAVALGIAAGALLRRTLPAIAVTLAGFIGARLAVAQFLRPHFLSPTTVYHSLTGAGGYFVPTGPSLLVANGIVDRHGHVIPESGYFTGGANIDGVPSAYLSAACQKIAQLSTTPQNAIDACIRASGVRSYSSYQLAPHYWPFQFIETGIFAAAAAVLVAVAFAALRHRDA